MESWKFYLIYNKNYTYAVFHLILLKDYENIMENCMVVLNILLVKDLGGNIFVL